jgi:hypothetical protein
MRERGNGERKPMDFYHPEMTAIDKKKPVFEATCRYCGQRFLFEQGENIAVIVGPKGVKNPQVIGYCHDVCLRKHRPSDDLRLPTKKASQE